MSELNFHRSQSSQLEVLPSLNVSCEITMEDV